MNVGPRNAAAPVGDVEVLSSSVSRVRYEDGLLYQLKVVRGESVMHSVSALREIGDETGREPVWQNCHSPWDVSHWDDDNLYLNAWVSFDPDNVRINRC